MKTQRFNFKDYKVTIYWHEPDQLWVAQIEEIPFCFGDGKNAKDAIANLEKSFKVLKETYEEENLSWPDPGHIIKTKDLKNMSDIFKLSSLAKKSGINYHTLQTKLKRKKELTYNESKKIMHVLKNKGMQLINTH